MEHSTEEIQRYEEAIEFMEQMIKVHSWESCNKILAYLSLYGKMQAGELSDRLGLEGAKSVYKPLNRLLDAGLIAKEGERNAYFYTTRKETNDPPFTAGFIAYLIDQEKYQLIADYLTTANQSSMGFLQVMTDIMEDQIMKNNNPSLGEAYLSDSVFVEAILSSEDFGPLKSRFIEVIKEEFPKYEAQIDDPTAPIPNPAAFFMALIPLNSPE